MKKLLLASLLLAGCTTDENLAFRSPQSVGATRWAVSLGGAGADHLAAVATDSIGDVVAVGITESNPVDFGSGPMMVPRQTGYHSYITKRVASDGAERWTRALLPTTADSSANAFGVATTPDDDIVVIGTYVGTVDFGGQTLTVSATGGGDGFLAKYAPDGTLRWVRGFDADAVIELFGVAADSTGQIYVIGQFGGTIDLAGQPVTSQSLDGGSDGFLAAFDPTGTQVWGAPFPGTSDPLPSDIGIASNGDVVVVGSFRGTASFGGATHDAGDPWTGFLTRFRSDGLYKSSTVIGDPGPFEQIAHTRVTFRGAQTIVKYSKSEGSMVVGLDTANNLVWSSNWIENHEAHSPPYRLLATTPSGLITTPTFNNAPSNLYDPSTHHGEMEVFTIDETGDEGLVNMWSTSLGQATMVDVAVGVDDEMVFGGIFSGTGTFGTDPLQTTGFLDSDIVLVMATAR